MTDCTRRDFMAISVSGLAALGTANAWPQEPDGLVVHEWGVITVANGTGVANVRTAGAKGRKKAEVPAGLPAFVPTFESVVGKTIRDWEQQPVDKPIVYFYAAAKTQVAFRVDVPSGRPRAWFPSTEDWGPRPDLPSHKGGLRRFGGEDPRPPKAEDIPPEHGHLHWKQLTIDPAIPEFKPAEGWWAAAREVDAASVRSGKEAERFLFYDAFAIHKPNLRIRWKEGGKVEVENTGAYPLRHVVALRVVDGECSSASRRDLAAGEKAELTVAAGTPGNFVDGLVDVGLYKKEALSLAEIWKEEFFALDGSRVLVVLPREIYDSLLPASITPKPREFTRVLIAHIECLDAAQQVAVAALIKGLESESLEERSRTAEKLKAYGPMAEEMIREALKVATDEEVKSRLQGLLPKSK